MSDDRRLSLSGRGKLGAGKSVETGQVRQSFSHGRSKQVVVERKKRRLIKRDPSETPEVQKVEAPAVRPIKAPEEDSLTSRERDTRAEALKDAIRQAEEERMRASEERRKRQEDSLKEEKKTVKTEEKEAVTSVETEARRKAEDDARLKAEEAKRQAEEVETAEILEAQRVEQEATARAEKDASAHKGVAKAKPVEEGSRADQRKQAEKKRTAGGRPRRGDSRRRSGKLTVAMALEGGEEVRQRSLAALKRAQAKLKRGGQPSASGPRKTRSITVPESITVAELANRMAERGSEVIKVLNKMDVQANMDEILDQDTAELVVGEFGHTVNRVREADVMAGIFGVEDNPDNLRPRPPVVTVMGHVDHGKTSILDAMRKTDVVSGEAGGITQHIGAYQVDLGTGEKITFIDTPGHEAFTEMRARGAGATDVIVLVVAADDGVMPQTIEAINHAKAAGVPLVVAINKIDREGAEPDRVRNELLQHEVIVEKLSGDVLDVEVSATKGTNLDKLKETILLQSELLELKADPDRSAEGVVIEAQLEKGRGPVTTVLVRTGTLNIGDIIVAGPNWGKVRALIDDQGNKITSALPSQPVEVLGLNGVPPAGEMFAIANKESQAREIAEYRADQSRKKRTERPPVSLENIFEILKENKIEEFPIVIKADVQGSLEAITMALGKIGNEEIRCQILHGGVGGIAETDVTLAQASSAPVIGFNVRANAQARAQAEKDGVPINYYAVIYNLVDDIRAAMTGRLKPLFEENILGLAEVKDVFSAGKGKAAGCVVIDGVIRKDAKARLLRDDIVVFEGELSSLRRFKDDVDEVKAGTECGLTIKNYADIKAKDQIEIYELIEKERSL